MIVVGFKDRLVRKELIQLKWIYMFGLYFDAQFCGNVKDMKEQAN